MGLQPSKVSNYQLRVDESVHAQVPQQPQHPAIPRHNGHRHSAPHVPAHTHHGAKVIPVTQPPTLANSPNSSAKTVTSFYSPVNQTTGTTRISSVALSPTRASSASDLLGVKGGGKHEIHSNHGKAQYQLVCSPKLPWLIKKARFGHLSPTAIEFGRVIGRGLMGTVRICRLAGEDKYFVVKQLRKDSVIKHHDERHVRSEKEVLSTLSSPFCIRLFGTFQDRGHLYFALEYVPGGELFRRLDRKKGFPPLEAKFYLTEIFCALEHLQAHGYAYRDLKPENVTLDEEGHCKLIDFGFSTACSLGHRMMTICGTPAYLSPEQLDGKLTHGYTRVVDWWSFGVLLYELLTGKTPFCHSLQESAYEIFMRILKNKIRFPRGFDAEAKELVTRLCYPALEKRLCTPEEIKQQPYFTVPWSAVQERRLIPPYVPGLKEVGDSHCFEKYPEHQVVIDDGDGQSADGRFADF